MEPKLAFVIRIRGVNELSTKFPKVLQLLSFCQIFNSTFVKSTRFLLTRWELWNQTLHAAAAKSLQSCPTLCDPIDGSPPGSPAPGILQARVTGVGCHCLLRKKYIYEGKEVYQILTVVTRGTFNSFYFLFYVIFIFNFLIINMDYFCKKKIDFLLNNFSKVL